MSVEMGGDVPVLTRINYHTGLAITQDDWERYEWIDVTTFCDPIDVRRYILSLRRDGLIYMAVKA